MTIGSDSVGARAVAIRRHVPGRHAPRWPVVERLALPLGPALVAAVVLCGLAAGVTAALAVLVEGVLGWLS